MENRTERKPYKTDLSDAEWAIIEATHSWRQAWWTATRDKHPGGDQCDFLPLEDRLRMASFAA